MSNLTALECAVLYHSLKQHFTNSKYDFFYYSGKLKINSDKIKSQKEFYQFKKLSTFKYPGNVILSNVVSTIPSKPFPYIADIISDKGINIYDKWESRKQSLSYLIKNEELEKLDKDFDKNFQIKNNQLPQILRLQLNKKIIPELAPIACIVYPHVIESWNSKKDVNPILDVLVQRTFKYIPFLDIDKDKIKSLFDHHFQKIDINTIETV